MVNARTWFTLFIISLGTVAATASCGSDEATGGSGGAGSIISGGGRAGSMGRAGSTGTTNSALGSECTTDTQCGDGLICAKANGTLFGGAGPSNGMCTMACELGGSECGALQSGAECLNFGSDSQPQGYCSQSCELGEPVELTDKCHGRADFVCLDLGEDTALPFCVPLCRSDAECGSGLFCDPSGLCSKTKPAAGDPVGTPCDPEASSNGCEGVCLRSSADGVTPVTGMCVELCSSGSECMYGPGSNPAPGGLCVPLSDAWGAIDLGYCLPNCTCTGDCPFPGDLCRKWATDESNIANALGAPGLCYPVLAQSVELTCGGEGGAGGASGEGGAGGDGAGGAGGAGGDGDGNTSAGGVAGSD